MDEPESGIESYWVGQCQLFNEQAQAAVDTLDNAGAKTIVTLCGEDLGMLRSKYPQYSCAPQANAQRSTASTCCAG